MRNSRVIEYLKEKHSSFTGIDFEPSRHPKLELNTCNFKFEINSGSDSPNSIITFISIRFKTDDKSELIRALNELREYFDIGGIPDINMHSEFYNVSDILLDVDTHFKEDLRLILKDRVSTILRRYEIELKLAKYSE